MSSTAALIDTAVERCAVWPVASGGPRSARWVVVVRSSVSSSRSPAQGLARCSLGEVQRPRRLGGFAFPPDPHALT